MNLACCAQRLKIISAKRVRSRKCSNGHASCLPGNEEEPRRISSARDDELIVHAVLSERFMCEVFCCVQKLQLWVFLHKELLHSSNHACLIHNPPSALSKPYPKLSVCFARRNVLAT